MKKEIERSLEVLSAGGTIIYPTDTIWGIGCDATNQKAVEKVNDIKGRPADKGYITLASDFDMIKEYTACHNLNPWEVIYNNNRNATIIYPASKNLAKGVAVLDGSVGMRTPADEFCQELVMALGRPVVSTSANKDGAPYPSRFSEIEPALLAAADYVVNLKQDDTIAHKPSSIIRITAEGNAEYIRK